MVRRLSPLRRNPSAVAERSRLRLKLILFEHFKLSGLLQEDLWGIAASLGSTVGGLSGVSYVAFLYEKDGKAGLAT
jgi:hypothetical protein